MRPTEAKLPGSDATRDWLVKPVRADADVKASMTAPRPDPYEPTWSRRSEAAWLDTAVFAGGVLAVVGVLSHRWAVVAAGVAMTLAFGWVVLRKLEGRITARGLAWLLIFNGVLAVVALIFILGNRGIIGTGAIVAAVFVGPRMASSVTGVAR